MNLPRSALVICLALSGASPASAFDYGAFFREHCIRCHGPEKQKGDIRLDRERPPHASPESIDTWGLIADVIESGDMPPSKEPRPPADEIEAITRWIAAELAGATRPVPGLRRMNRVEYEHTVQDLFGIDTPLLDLLPEDTPVQGFDNVATGLGISSVLMERYLEAADTAFAGVIRRIRPLPPSTRRAVLMETRENKDSVDKKKGGVITHEGAFVDFTPGWPPARIDSAHPIEGGLYRCRVAVFPHHPNEHRTLTVALFTGPLFGDGKRHLRGVFDVTGTPEKPRVIEFTAPMEEGHTIHILPWIYPEHVTWRDKHEERPGVGILWAETHGPLDQAFPSEAQNRLFRPARAVSMKEGRSIYMRHRKGVKEHYVDSASPREDAASIIRALVPRAFRRPVDPQLTGSFVKLTLSRLDAGNTFEEAVRAGVTAVLCSPHFLLLNKEPEVDDYALASRLSYFLWSTMPDRELMKLAAEGRLGDAKVRHAQVERMLDDPKIGRFVENFTGQWLDLREIEFTTPDKKLYPEFEPILQYSMLEETHGFFRHLLEKDLSVLNFVDSDFAILNQRLAEHYGIPGVRGHEQFRVVALPEDSIRGGILTHGSVLKVTANGTTTSPVLRGVWVLDRILGRPPSPPPPGVPAVEPDIRGATSIREQLDRHSADESCARCHARIDPPGFALEEFDAIGGERTFYRSLGEGKKLGRLSYRQGPPVEPASRMPGGENFSGFTEFRAQLLEDPETIARAIAEKLLVYGTGRPLTHGDRETVEAVVEAARGKNFGLRSMIHAVVESELFHRP